MENIILIAILVVILGFAIWYIVHEKKKGKKCVGCHLCVLVCPQQAIVSSGRRIRPEGR